jgi:hypothetical protein
MAMRKLEKSEWRPFLDALSKSLVGKRAEIEVASLDLGDQIEAEFLPLLGIVFDNKDDTVEIALEGVDHLISNPREIYVDIASTGLTNIEITDSDGRRHIVQLRDPLMLPPPSKIAG